MRHRVAGSQFNRNTKQRKALLRGLVRSLFEAGSITTTKPKAKETQRIADKLLAKAKQPTVASRRVLHRFFGKRDVVNTLVDVIAPLYEGINSGFTTIQVLGVRRGDNTEMVKLSLIKKPETLGFAKTESAGSTASTVAKKQESEAKESKAVVTKKPAATVTKKTVKPKSEKKSPKTGTEK